MQKYFDHFEAEILSNLSIMLILPSEYLFTFGPLGHIDHICDCFPLRDSFLQLYCTWFHTELPGRNLRNLKRLACS